LATPDVENNGTSVEISFIPVRILSDVPPFSGSGGRIFDLKKEDVLTLPSVYARPLIEGGKALALNLEYSIADIKRPESERTILSQEIGGLNGATKPLIRDQSALAEPKWIYEVRRPDRNQQKLVAQKPRRPVSILGIWRDEDRKIMVTVLRDAKEEKWAFTELEMEIATHSNDYPSLVLEILQDAVRTWTKHNPNAPEGVQQENGRTKPKDQFTRLLELAEQNSTEFFHDAGINPFVKVWYGDHFKVMAEEDFPDWLSYRAWQAERKAPSDDALKRAVRTVAIRAKWEGPDRSVFLRLAEHEGAILYDLCNDKWQVLRISADGWRVLDNSPVMFRRFAHMGSQVVPIRGRPEALDELVRLANIGTLGRELFKIQLAVSFVPGISQMGACTMGLEGTGKSTTQEIAVAVIDPSTEDRNCLPSRKNDLDLILATRCIASFDNLSKITAEQSDMLSRAVTGASSSQRKLYTDNCQISRAYMTQIFINAIDLSGAKPDFFDRMIVYRTSDKFDGPNLSTTKIENRIKELLPYALGNIFDLLSKAMKFRDDFTEEDLKWAPRMVDWYLWTLAVAKAMGKPDGWLEGLLRPFIDRRNYEAIADQPLTKALEYIAHPKGFVGTPAELFQWLNSSDRDIPFNCQIDPKDREWPKSAISLGKKLPRITVSLRSHGVFVYRLTYSRLKKYRGHLKGLEWARGGLDVYGESERMVIVSSVELDLGRDDDSEAGG
jgi:hypothetical protein